MELWFFFGAMGIQIAGAVTDAMSSLGQIERTRIYQDKDHRFSPRKFIAWEAGMIGFYLLTLTFADPKWGVIAMTIQGLAHFWRARKNNKLKAQ